MARSPESAWVREIPSGRLYITVLRSVSCFETQCIYGMLGHTWFDEADEEPTAVDKLKEGFPEPRKNDIRNGSLA